jgi:hypothetical protein
VRKKEHLLNVPGPQWSWKITVTIACAIVGVILAVYLFRVL